MDGREGGFIVIHRRVRSSPLYRSLTAEQRSVFYSLLLLANWRPERILFAGKWQVIARGEFFHSLETIAEEAGCGVGVVRGTLAKVMADDSEAGGRGAFLKERWTSTVVGRGLRVLCVVNYDQYQRVTDDDSTPVSTELTRGSHGANTTLAPREQVEPKEPVEPKKKTAAAPPDVRRAPLIARITEGARRRVPGWKFRKKYVSAVTESLTLGTEPEILALWDKSLSLPRYPGTADFAAFVSRWNDVLATSTSGPAPPRQMAMTPSANSEFQGGGIDTRTGKHVT